jgi:hypothetical protein
MCVCVYCTANKFRQLYIWETNIMSGSFILCVVETDVWPVRSKTWQLVIFKLYVVCLILLFELWLICNAQSESVQHVQRISHCPLSVFCGFDRYCHYQYDWNAEVLKNMYVGMFRCHCLSRNSVMICSLTLLLSLAFLVCCPVWIIITYKEALHILL